jgi:glycosyltransferase involved in cell wall biosynthesis
MRASKKKLVIDGQIFQTAAKDRGMGRYSVCLIQALLNHKSNYEEIEILLTSSLPMTGKVKKDLERLFDGANFRSLDLSITQKHKIEDAFAYNEAILNKYVNTQLNRGFAVDFLIPSLFQEPIAAVFPDNVNKLLVFYDLIPYLYHKRYQPLIPFENYLKRFKYVFEADRIFAISQTVADDLHVYLGIPKARLVRIDGAAIRANKAPAKPSIQVSDKFILMPTSDDPRKNNLRAVLGFEEFRVTGGDLDYKLVITSRINQREQQYLQLFSKNLVFTGNLPEHQLDWLYENCQATLFVPEYEGLGLPILEAVEFGKSVICSSISVFKEISEDVFCYCDYEDSTSIAAALKAALTTSPNQAEYKKIKAYYTWQKTAGRLIAGVGKPKTPVADPKPKIAVFTPTPEGYSAIGKVVAESHAVMSEHFDIDYYADPGLYNPNIRPNFLKHIAPMHSARAFGAKTYRDYDAVIYHIGNGDYHLESIKNAFYLPGYAIPHDTDIREAYRVLGETKMMPPGRIQLEEKLNSPNNQSSPKNLTTVLNRQLGVLTHSKYAESSVKGILNEPVVVKRANLPTAVPDLPAFKPAGKIIIGLAGIIADIKGIAVIEAIAQNPAFNNCLIWLFGFNYASKETIDRLSSYENVSVTTSLTDFEFQANLSKLHIFVNYRMGYNGETSLATIEAMRHSVAVIVRDIGWYGELPNNAVVKTKNIDEVLEKLQVLVNDTGALNAVGERAKKYVAENFSHEQYALALKKLIEQSPDKDSLNYKLAKRLKDGRIRSKRQYTKFLKENL